jgi:hypothetical protein
MGLYDDGDGPSYTAWTPDMLLNGYCVQRFEGLDADTLVTPILARLLPQGTAVEMQIYAADAEGSISLRPDESTSQRALAIYIPKTAHRFQCSAGRIHSAFTGILTVRVRLTNDRKNLILRMVPGNPDDMSLIQEHPTMRRGKGSFSERRLIQALNPVMCLVQ